MGLIGDLLVLFSFSFCHPRLIAAEVLLSQTVCYWNFTIPDCVLVALYKSLTMIMMSFSCVINLV